MDQMSESNDAQDYPAEAEPAPAASGGGYKICIRVNADGTFSVYKEDVAEGMKEGEPAAQGEAGAPISDFGDALRAAMQIFKENPVGDSEQASFDAGFQGKGPRV
ncbi:MAG: hypothetical protein HY348_06415 [Nitrospira defluvii]|nr:hypothetical protein [Nitrospira defluvii]